MSTLSGLDIGTSFIVLARQEDNEDVQIVAERDAFLELPYQSSFVSFLSDKKISYIQKGNSIYLIGQRAVELADIRGDTVRRPMSVGILTPASREKMSFEVIKIIIEAVLKKGSGICCYSVPARPFDNPSITVDFHQAVMNDIISSLGYQPYPVSEAQALATIGLVESDLTGISISAGAGQTNVAFMHMGYPVILYSIARAGDWIDIESALAVGLPATRVSLIKETVLDLSKPVTAVSSEEDIILRALSAYYQKYCEYICSLISKQIQEAVATAPKLKEGLTVVIGGGTSMVPGFIDLFHDTIKKTDLGVSVKAVKQVKDPLFAVAKGLLAHAKFLQRSVK